MNTASPFSSRAEAATNYIGRGWAPIPLETGSKAPHTKGWTDLRISVADAHAYFDTLGNIGLLLGQPSGNLVVVDLDCPEALALAAHFLPETRLISGHGLTDRTHYYYVVNQPLPSRRYQCGGDVLVEIKSTGSQVLGRAFGDRISQKDSPAATMSDFFLSKMTLAPSPACDPITLIIQWGLANAFSSSFMRFSSSPNGPAPQRLGPAMVTYLRRVCGADSFQRGPSLN
jgi:Bifunctional DNA primase/polymerase, N-terminal